MTIEVGRGGVSPQLNEGVRRCVLLSKVGRGGYTL